MSITFKEGEYRISYPVIQYTVLYTVCLLCLFPANHRRALLLMFACHGLWRPCEKQQGCCQISLKSVISGCGFYLKKSLCRCWVFLFFFPYMYGSERQIHKLHGILWLLWSSGVRRDLHTNVTFDLNASSSTIFHCLLVFWLGNTKCDLSVMLFLPVELFSCYVERKRNQGVKKWRKSSGNNFLCLTTGRISRINQIQLTVTRQFQYD